VARCPEFLKPLLSIAITRAPPVIWSTVKTAGDRSYYLVAEAGGGPRFKKVGLGVKLGHEAHWKRQGVPNGERGVVEILNRLHNQELVLPDEAVGGLVSMWKVRDP